MTDTASPPPRIPPSVRLEMALPTVWTRKTASMPKSRKLKMLPPPRPKPMLGAKKEKGEKPKLVKPP